MLKALENRLTIQETRSAFGLAAIYGVRMLGLFMILPVFALYARDLADVTPTLVGLAIGIYGLTQALLQIPLGMLSDRVGRKPVIVGGLLVFGMGSIVAAMSTSIEGIILGRALQGSGAIAAATLALAADLTRENIRTRVMALIGLSIGLAFMLAMVLGPILNEWIGVPGIFWLTALLALLAIGIVLLFIPTPVQMKHQRDTEVTQGNFSRVLTDGQLLRLDFGIFALHLMLTANFVVLPLILQDQFSLASAEHWKIYLPVMLVSFLLMLPFLIIAEKQRRMKTVFVSAIGLLVVVEGMLFLSQPGFWGTVLLVLLYFAAFNLLEASLPSLVTKLSPVDAKGTAMGIYSTSQFLGIFAGGIVGGWVHAQYGLASVYLLCAVVAGAWLLFALSMKRPRYLSNYLINIGRQSRQEAQELVAKLTAVQGVAEAVVVDDVAYLKVEKHALDEEALRAFSKPSL